MTTQQDIDAIRDALNYSGYWEEEYCSLDSSVTRTAVASLATLEAKLTPSLTDDELRQLAKETADSVTEPFGFWTCDHVAAHNDALSTILAALKKVHGGVK